MIKPGELIDIVEVTPLKLSDRRIYNLLIRHAWDRIEEPVEHAIAKKKLRGSHNVNARVDESVLRLMGAVAEIRAEADGEASVLRVQLLGSNVEHCRRDGMLYYRFPAELRRVIKESRVFARLQTDVMFALSSKYGLALYEMIQKRGNLDYIWFEDFPLERLRALLGVPPGKLTGFKNLNRWALQPAMAEVNALSEFGVEAVALFEGRRVVAVRLAWRRKSEAKTKAAFATLRDRLPNPVRGVGTHTGHTTPAIKRLTKSSC
jgi:hypothetical protein